MILSFPKYTIDVDVEKTKLYYNTADFVSEDCSCNGCRNYEKAIDFLPMEDILFFTQLGIEMKKAREVWVYCTNADDTVFYGGIYHVCGKLVEGESVWVFNNPNPKYWEEEKTYPVTENLSVFFHNSCVLLDDNFPLPAIQLEILADMPWVLAELNDYPKDAERRK